MRFLLVDSIGEWQADRSMSGIKQVAMSEDFLEHHFPGDPIMPGAMLLEAHIQLAAWLVAASSGFERWFLPVHVARCAFYGFVRPGDRVELGVQAQPSSAPESRLAFMALGTVGGEKRISADIEGMTVPLAELWAPEKCRHHFEALDRRREPLR